MVDDVLRLRATVVSEEALANLRLIGREIGMVGTRGVPQIRTLNAEFTRLSTTIRRFGGEVATAIPALGGLGLGAAGAGLAAAQLMRSLTDMSKRIVELKYASKELGMSERDVRAWSSAAEKAGVSSGSMMQGLPLQPSARPSSLHPPWFALTGFRRTECLRTECGTGRRGC